MYNILAVAAPVCREVYVVTGRDRDGLLSRQ